MIDLFPGQSSSMIYHKRCHHIRVDVEVKPTVSTADKTR